MEVFFCSASVKSSLRHSMERVCLDRWYMEHGISIRFPRMELTCSDKDFQRERRIFADQEARDPYYIVADDDCLPEHEPFLERCVDIMRHHPQFAVLSFYPNNSHLNGWDPPPEEKHFLVDGLVYEDLDVLEHVSVGGIRVCQKGCLTKWPPMEGKTYDMEQAIALRANGYRVGYFKEIFMCHLGRGYSSVWP